MGCAPPKSEGGEWNTVWMQFLLLLHKCGLRPELKLAIGPIQSIFILKKQLSVDFKIGLFNKKLFYWFEVFLGFFFL